MFFFVMEFRTDRHGFQFIQCWVILFLSMLNDFRLSPFGTHERRLICVSLSVGAGLLVARHFDRRARLFRCSWYLLLQGDNFALSIDLHRLVLWLRVCRSGLVVSLLHKISMLVDSDP